MAEFILGTIAGFVLGIVVVAVVCFRIIRDLYRSEKLRRMVEAAQAPTRATTAGTVERDEAN